MSIDSWDTPPESVTAAPNNIHIWRLQPDHFTPQLEYLISCLSEEELKQGRRLVKLEHRNRFLISHAVLRLILSRYLDIPAQNIQFQKGSHGKPFLDGLALQFNMTHSNNMVLYAITAHSELGIDVEYVKKQHRMDALVKRFFSKREHEEFQSIPESEKRLAFYRAWTRKEAYLKATGLGLSFPLNQFDVSFASKGEHCLLNVEGSNDTAQNWTLLSFEPAQNYMSSVATKASKCYFIAYEYSSN